MQTLCPHGHTLNDPSAEPCYRDGCYTLPCVHAWECVCPDAGGPFMFCKKCEDVRPMEADDCNE
jgi:hypothetical protein